MEKDELDLDELDELDLEGDSVTYTVYACGLTASRDVTGRKAICSNPNPVAVTTKLVEIFEDEDSLRRLIEDLDSEFGVSHQYISLLVEEELEDGTSNTIIEREAELVK